MRPKQAQAVEDYDNYAAFVARSRPLRRLYPLCVSQAATHDPSIGYHHRRNAEYD